MTIVNAIVSTTTLGREDRGIPTCFLYLYLGDGDSQGFGGYDLRYKDYAQSFIFELPEVLGVRSWEKLPGTLCRVEYDDGPGASRRIVRIGHVLEDRWFEAPR